MSQKQSLEPWPNHEIKYEFTPNSFLSAVVVFNSITASISLIYTMLSALGLTLGMKLAYEKKSADLGPIDIYVLFYSTSAFFIFCSHAILCIVAAASISRRTRKGLILGYISNILTLMLILQYFFINSIFHDSFFIFNINAFLAIYSLIALFCHRNEFIQKKEFNFIQNECHFKKVARS